MSQQVNKINSGRDFVNLLRQVLFPGLGRWRGGTFVNLLRRCGSGLGQLGDGLRFLWPLLRPRCLDGGLPLYGPRTKVGSTHTAGS